MKREHIAAGAAGAVLLIVLIWYVALWGPEGKHLNTAHQRLTQAQAQVANAQEQLFLLQAEKPKLKAEEKVLQHLITALPNGPSLDQLLRTVHQAGVAAGVDISAVSTPQPSGWASGAGAPAQAVAGGGPQFITLGVDVSGTPAEILQFVRALDEQPRIYVVTSFALGSTANVQTNLSVEAFFVSGATTDPTFPGITAP